MQRRAGRFRQLLPERIQARAFSQVDSRREDAPVSVQVNPVRVAQERVSRVAGLQVPDFELPIPAGRGEVLAVGAERDTANGAVVASVLQASDFLAGGGPGSGAGGVSTGAARREPVHGRL